MVRDLSRRKFLMHDIPKGVALILSPMIFPKSANGIDLNTSPKIINPKRDIPKEVLSQWWQVGEYYTEKNEKNHGYLFFNSDIKRYCFLGNAHGFLGKDCDSDPKKINNFKINGYNLEGNLYNPFELILLQYGVDLGIGVLRDNIRFVPKNRDVLRLQDLALGRTRDISSNTHSSSQNVGLCYMFDSKNQLGKFNIMYPTFSIFEGYFNRAVMFEEKNIGNSGLPIFLENGEIIALVSQGYEYDGMSFEDTVGVPASQIADIKKELNSSNIKCFRDYRDAKKYFFGNYIFNRRMSWPVAISNYTKSEKLNVKSGDILTTGSFVEGIPSVYGYKPLQMFESDSLNDLVSITFALDRRNIDEGFLAVLKDNFNVDPSKRNLIKVISSAELNEGLRNFADELGVPQESFSNKTQIGYLMSLKRLDVNRLKPYDGYFYIKNN